MLRIFLQTFQFQQLHLIPAVLKYFSCENLYNHKYFETRKNDRKDWLKGAKLDEKNMQLTQPQIGNASKNNTLITYLEGITS